MKFRFNSHYNTIAAYVVLVFAFFAWQTGGKILNPQNITNLISQNAYVFILATGMLLCILTGGNIDLSVGSVVCFTGAIGALLMAGGMNMWLAVVIMLAIGLAIGAGFYSCAFICIAYMAACMYLLPPLEQKLTRRAHHINISLEIERMEHLGAIVTHLHDENVRIFDFAVNRNGTGPLASFLCQFSAILPERRDHPELLAELSALEGVILIEEI